MSNLAGTYAQERHLVNLTELVRSYYSVKPNPHSPDQRVSFGTSGHRGCSLNGSFNDDHIAAICLAIAEYRTSHGFTGPLYLGTDTHPLSEPAEKTAREVLAAAGVQLRIADSSGPNRYVPTPALSHAIIKHNRGLKRGLADGIIITPSHNPPRDGGIKYNPPHGGPADTEATQWIERRANQLLETEQFIHRKENPECEVYDFLNEYVNDLPQVINMEAIAKSKVQIAVHPMGGASQHYWERIAKKYKLKLKVLGPGFDPQWSFMTLDWDGKIRMDPSSKYAMASVLEHRNKYDLLLANDADADRHGIVTRDGGLMNPNHFLAVSIDYLLQHRPEWPQGAQIGKTIVSSRIIDRVVEAHGCELYEVPVGFKWFVQGLSSGKLVFGGEESAGASFVCFDGSAWSTDKDGILLDLLAAEIWAVTGKSPSKLYAELTEKFGDPDYERKDLTVTFEQKQRLAGLQESAVLEVFLAGERIMQKLTAAPGNGAKIGGLVLRTRNSWCAIRPSGTELVMKVYAESFLGAEHLEKLHEEIANLLPRLLR